MRISLVAAARRVDLTVPSAVPVADLLPDLVTRLGLPPLPHLPSGAPTRWRLTTTTGRPLGDSHGLSVQGVPDGAVLHLTPTAPTPPAARFDDLAEAIATGVADRVPGRDGEDAALCAHARRVLATASLALGVGAGLAAALAGAGASPAAVLAASVLLVGLLLGCARWLAGTSGRRADAMVAAWAAVALGAVAGVAGSTATGVQPAPAWAGLAAAVTAALAAATVTRHRLDLAPAVPWCATAVALGLAETRFGVDPAVTLAVVAALGVVLADRVAPATLAAMGVTRGHLPGDPAPDVGSGDANAEAGGALAAQVLTAHRWLGVTSAASAGLLVAGAPAAASLGPAGVALAVAMCAAAILGGRRHHAVAVARTRTWAALLALGLTAVVGVVTEPRSALLVAALLTVAGVVTLAVPNPSGRPTSLAVDVWADRLEGLALLGLVPLLVAATGLFDLVRG